MTYLQDLAAFACRTRLADLPPKVLERTRWVLADSLPVIAAGMQQPQMRALLKAHLSEGKAWILGAHRRAGALDAALLNGTAGTWLELNEGNLFAKDRGAPARHLGDDRRGGGRRPPERLRRAPHARADQRLGDDGHGDQPADPADGATVRNIFTGHAGHMGLMAARLVECGFTGEKDSPAAIYGKVLADGFDPAEATGGLRREWMLEQGYLKLHPTGRYAHSAIDALEDVLSRSPPLDIARIDRIEVKACRLAAMLKEKRVTSSFGARFSVPFALATILFHGRADLAAFEQAAVDNPAIQALAARVEVREEASYTARYPAEQPCDVRIVMAGGRALEGHCVITKGELARPHRPEELQAKFMQLGAPLWGEPVAQRLLQGFLSIEKTPDLAYFAQEFDL